jgi:2,4-dienoyl-CoA reductase-like NADH-dependent reductase (Old Yellow Enzyme family)
MREVIGVRLTNSLPQGSTATDLALRVTQELRKKGVVIYLRDSSSTGKKPQVAPYSGAMLAIVARSANGKFITTRFNSY